MVIYVIYICFPFVCCLFGCMSYLLAYLFLFHVPNQLKRSNLHDLWGNHRPTIIAKACVRVLILPEHQDPWDPWDDCIFTYSYSFGYSIWMSNGKQTNHIHTWNKKAETHGGRNLNQQKQHIQQQKNTKQKSGGVFGEDMLFWSFCLLTFVQCVAGMYLGHSMWCWWMEVELNPKQK